MLYFLNAHYLVSKIYTFGSFDSGVQSFLNSYRSSKRRFVPKRESDFVQPNQIRSKNQFL